MSSAAIGYCALMFMAVAAWHSYGAEYILAPLTGAIVVAALGEK